MSAHYTAQDMGENNQLSCNIGICTCSSVVISVIQMLSVRERLLFTPLKCSKCSRKNVFTYYPDSSYMREHLEREQTLVADTFSYANTVNI